MDSKLNLLGPFLSGLGKESAFPFMRLILPEVLIKDFCSFVIWVSLVVIKRPTHSCNGLDSISMLVRREGRYHQWNGSIPCCRGQAHLHTVDA